MKKAATIFVAIALAAFGLAACGSDDDDEETTAAETTAATETAGGGTETAAGGGAGGGATVDISAVPDGSFAYEQKTASAKAGPVTVNFDNPATLQHDVVIESQDGQEVGKTELVADGTDSFTAELAPGSYVFYCSVPGHREGGMEGTLKVN